MSMGEISAGLSGRFWGRVANAAGKVAEQRVQDFLMQCLDPRKANLGTPGKLTTVRGGKNVGAVPEFLTEAGTKPVNLEVKYTLPAKSISGGFERAAKQLQAGIGGRNTTILVGVVPSRLKTDKRRTDFLDAVSGDTSFAKILDGFAGLPGLLSEYLIEECL